MEPKHLSVVQDALSTKVNELVKTLGPISPDELAFYLSRGRRAVDRIILNIVEAAIPIFDEIVKLHTMMLILSDICVLCATNALQDDILSKYSMDENIFARGVTFADIYKRLRNASGREWLRGKKMREAKKAICRTLKKPSVYVEIENVCV